FLLRPLELHQALLGLGHARVEFLPRRRTTRAAGQRGGKRRFLCRLKIAIDKIRLVKFRGHDATLVAGAEGLKERMFTVREALNLELRTRKIGSIQVK